MGAHRSARSVGDAGHGRRDLEKLRLSLLVARRLRADPERVLRIERNNLHRWIRQNGPQPYYLEWQEIRDTQSVDEIIQLLLSEDGKGEHLRQTSPFAGVLTDAERAKALLVREDRPVSQEA